MSTISFPTYHSLMGNSCSWNTECMATYLGDLETNSSSFIGAKSTQETIVAGLAEKIDIALREGGQTGNTYLTGNVFAGAKNDILEIVNAVNTAAQEAMGNMQEAMENALTNFDETKFFSTEENVKTAIKAVGNAVANVIEGVDNLSNAKQKVANTAAIARAILNKISDSNVATLVGTSGVYTIRYIDNVQATFSNFISLESVPEATSLTNRKVIAIANSGSTQFMFDEWMVANGDDSEISEKIDQVKGKYNPVISDEKARIILWINLVLRRIWGARSVTYTANSTQYFAPYEILNTTFSGLIDDKQSIKTYKETSAIQSNANEDTLINEGILWRISEKITLNENPFDVENTLNAKNWYDARLICNRELFVHVLALCLSSVLAKIKNINDALTFSYITEGEIYQAIEILTGENSVPGKVADAIQS